MLRPVQVVVVVHHAILCEITGSAVQAAFFSETLSLVF